MLESCLSNARLYEGGLVRVNVRSKAVGPANIRI